MRLVGSRRWIWLVIIGLPVVLLAGVSVFWRVGPLGGLLGESGAPSCGYAWRVVPAASASRTYNELHSLAALGKDNVWASGIYGGEEFAFTLVEHWDGKEWTESKSPSVESFSNHLYGMKAVGEGDVWIVGASHQGTDLWRTLALHWNESEWGIVDTPSRLPISSLNAVDGEDAGDVWAVGDEWSGSRSATTKALTMHWDGKEWRVVETGVTEPNATLNAVAVVGKGDVWAAGSYSDASGTVLKPLLLHWNRDGWERKEANSDGAIWGLSAVGKGDVWAVGSFGPQTLALHWDGEAWTRSATASPGDGKGNSTLNAVAAVSANEVWAVGSFSEGGKDRLLSMRWDGKEWKQVEAPKVGEYSDVLSAVEAVPGTSEVWAAGASIADQLGNNLPVLLRWSEPCK